MPFDLLFWGFIVLCFPLGVALRWARDDYNRYCIEAGYKKGPPKIADSIDALERELFPELKEWQRWNNIGVDPDEFMVPCSKCYNTGYCSTVKFCNGRKFGFIGYSGYSR